ncbi:MAG TPA: hypothetical protein VN645_13695 [Steroidobacteraceae bacterium]|nr:hypothetical protein [Steroidobacteraceae bacterium]
MRPEVLRCALLAVLLLGGCSSVAALRGEKPASVAAPSGEAIQAAQLSSYIASLQQLVQGSPAEQAEVLAAARAAYEQAHQGPAALRYALVLAAPDHPGRDPALAEKLLREVLAHPELLTIAERAQAVVELQRTVAELRLAAENDRLVGELQKERERQRNAAPSATALQRRLQNELDENARLRKQLDEKNAKLDAIINIERGISDRPPAPATEGRTP